MRSTRYITHHYDEEVLGEGIRVLIAVPTLHGGEVTGMVYCGHRSRTTTPLPRRRETSSDESDSSRSISLGSAIDGNRSRSTPSAERLYPDS
jgi:hypothetical protein